MLTEKQLNRYEWAAELIQQLMGKRYTGKLIFNFFEGNISNANKEESLKP